MVAGHRFRGSGVHWRPDVLAVKTLGYWFQFSGLAFKETSQSSWCQIPWRCCVKNVTKPGRMSCRGSHVIQSLLCPDVQVLSIQCGRKLLARIIGSALVSVPAEAGDQRVDFPVACRLKKRSSTCGLGIWPRVRWREIAVTPCGRVRRGFSGEPAAIGEFAEEFLLQPCLLSLPA